jgi:hypothetical protein
MTYYFNYQTYSIETTKSDTSVRLPFPLLLLLAPAMGLVFVMFLPFIGIALTIGLGLKLLARNWINGFSRVRGWCKVRR